MLARVRGEEGEALPVRTKQTVGATFGRELIFSNRAVPYDGQDGGGEGAIPDGFPGAKHLRKAEIHRLDEVPGTEEELVALKSIGEALAGQILDALDALVEDEPGGEDGEE